MEGLVNEKMAPTFSKLEQYINLIAKVGLERRRLADKKARIDECRLDLAKRFGEMDAAASSAAVASASSAAASSAAAAKAAEDTRPDFKNAVLQEFQKTLETVKMPALGGEAGSDDDAVMVALESTKVAGDLIAKFQGKKGAGGSAIENQTAHELFGQHLVSMIVVLGTAFNDQRDRLRKLRDSGVSCKETELAEGIDTRSARFEFTLPKGASRKLVFIQQSDTGKKARFEGTLFGALRALLASLTLRHGAKEKDFESLNTAFSKCTRNSVEARVQGYVTVWRLALKHIGDVCGRIRDINTYCKKIECGRDASQQQKASASAAQAGNTLKEPPRRASQGKSSAAASSALPKGDTSVNALSRGAAASSVEDDDGASISSTEAVIFDLGDTEPKRDVAGAGTGVKRSMGAAAAGQASADQQLNQELANAKKALSLFREEYFELQQQHFVIRQELSQTILGNRQLSVALSTGQAQYAALIARAQAAERRVAELEAQNAAKSHLEDKQRLEKSVQELQVQLKAAQERAESATMRAESTEKRCAALTARLSAKSGPPPGTSADSTASVTLASAASAAAGGRLKKKMMRK